MAAVLSFWQFPEEEEVLLDHVERSGEIVAVPFEKARRRENLAPRPLRACIQHSDPDIVVLGLRQHAGLIETGSYVDEPSSNQSN